MVKLIAMIIVGCSGTILICTPLKKPISYVVGIVGILAMAVIILEGGL